MRSRLGKTLWAAMCIALIAPSITAQEVEPTPADAHQQLITTNPFGPIFEWYNVEYERKIRHNASIGFTASYITPGNDSLGTANAIFRFYPKGTAFKGFYVGGRTGAYRVNDFDDNGTFFGAGLELGYTWLMGARQNWYVGLGIGFTRIFGGDLDGSAVIPQLRLINFGYSF